MSSIKDQKTNKGLNILLLFMGVSVAILVIDIVRDKINKDTHKVGCTLTSSYTDVDADKKVETWKCVTKLDRK